MQFVFGDVMCGVIAFRVNAFARLSAVEPLKSKQQSRNDQDDDTLQGKALIGNAFRNNDLTCKNILTVRLKNG